jgi:hypothetical protein
MIHEEGGTVQLKIKKIEKALVLQHVINSNVIKCHYNSNCHY